MIIKRELGPYLEFQWFLIALSVRPGSSFAISAHLLPIFLCTPARFSLQPRLLCKGLGLRVRAKQLLFFLVGPWFFPDFRVEVVVPTAPQSAIGELRCLRRRGNATLPLAALLANPARKMRRDE